MIFQDININMFLEHSSVSKSTHQILYKCRMGLSKFAGGVVILTTCHVKVYWPGTTMRSVVTDAKDKMKTLQHACLWFVILGPISPKAVSIQLKCDWKCILLLFKLQIQKFKFKFKLSYWSSGYRFTKKASSLWKWANFSNFITSWKLAHLFGELKVFH